MKKTIRALIRYALVGVVSNGLGFLAYLGLTGLGFAPKVTITCLYAFSATLGYFGNRSWSFRYQGPQGAAALRYALAHLTGYGINFMMLDVLVERLGYAHEAVQALAIPVVALYLFVVFRFFVFVSSRTEVLPS